MLALRSTCKKVTVTEMIIIPKEQNFVRLRLRVNFLHTLQQILPPDASSSKQNYTSHLGEKSLQVPWYGILCSIRIHDLAIPWSTALPVIPL